MIDSIRQMLEGLGAEVTVIIMSMLPVVEQEEPFLEWPLD